MGKNMSYSISVGGNTGGISFSLGNAQNSIRSPDVPPELQERGKELIPGKIYIMFHGTKSHLAPKIEREGFKISKDGMLGPGVYLSRDFFKAKAYGTVVFECMVSVRKVKKINRQGHPLQKRWQKRGYDTAWVPPNCGMNGSGMEEDCVKSPRQILKFKRIMG